MTTWRWRQKLGERSYTVLAVTAVALLVALIAYPFASLIYRLFSGGEGLAFLWNTFEDPDLGKTLWDTFVVAVLCGGAATIIAAIFAWLVERTDARIGWASSLMAVLPLLIPPITMSVGWMFLADPHVGYLNVLLRALLHLAGLDLDTGPLNIGTYSGVFFVYVIYLIPFSYLTITSSLRAMDPALEEAARMNGASVWRTLWDVSIPALKPALAGSMLVAVTFAVAVYSIPGTIGTVAGLHPISVAIVELMQTYPAKIEEALILSIFVLLLVGSLWWLQRHLSGLGRHAVIGGRAARSNVIELGAWRPVARYALIIYIVIAAVLPALALILISIQPFWSPQINLNLLTFDNFRTLFDPGSITHDALINSLTLGLAGATLTISLAVLLVAYAREHRGTLGTLSDIMGKLPSAIPHVVIAVAFILAFAGPPLRLFGTWLILLLAYVVMYIPQASVAAGTAYDQIGRELLEASRMSGAGGGLTLGRIAIPLMRQGIASGWMLIFVVITGELTASVLLSSTRNPVVGYVLLKIWDGGTFPQLAALSLMLAGVTSIVVIVVTVGLSEIPQRLSIRLLASRRSPSDDKREIPGPIA